MTRHMDPAPWPWLDRPRVLLENPDPEAATAELDTLRHAGYAVAVCSGPTSNDSCPVACSEGCALVEGADVVVTSLGLDRPEGRAVAEGLGLRYPQRPLVIEARPGELTTEQLLAAVGEALAR